MQMVHEGGHNAAGVEQKHTYILQMQGMNQWERTDDLKIEILWLSCRIFWAEI